jgi:hypothetical protein
MEKIISQTEKILQLRNYSPKTRKAYILYIRQYIIFSKNNAIKNKQQAVEMFLLDKYDKKQSP